MPSMLLSFQNFPGVPTLRDFLETERLHQGLLSCAVLPCKSTQQKSLPYLLSNYLKMFVNKVSLDVMLMKKQIGSADINTLP